MYPNGLHTFEKNDRESDLLYVWETAIGFLYVQIDKKLESVFF